MLRGCENNPVGYSVRVTEQRGGLPVLAFAMAPASKSGSIINLPMLREHG